MKSIAERQIRLACFDVSSGTVVVADESLPIAVEADKVSGDVIHVFTWPLSPGHSDRPAALDILVLEESIRIASPAAGGIVDINRRTGEATLIPLEADVGTLIACGDAVWAVASPDWNQQAAGEQQAGLPDRKRPVVWEQPTEEDITRYQELTSRFSFGRRAREGEGGRRTISEWRAAEGDFVRLGPATPIWRILAGAARRVDADLQEPILAAVAGRIAGVCRLPSDPVINHLSPRGSSFSCRYPGTVIMIGKEGTLEIIGPVPSNGGVVWADHGRLWLLGFEEETGDEPAPHVREVLLGDNRMAEPLDLPLHGPVAVIDGYIVDLGWREPTDLCAGRRASRGPVVRFVPVDGGDPREVEAPGLTDRLQVRTSDGEAWFGNLGTPALAVAAAGNVGMRELLIGLDCRPWMPRPQLPPDFDAHQFERASLSQFRGAFLGGWRTQEGEDRPFIENVSFDVIELRGVFPDREVVAIFQSSDRQGVRFGRRWRLYDELGNPCEHKYGDIGLMEDVASGSGGLPPLDSCFPDADGVVWF